MKKEKGRPKVSKVYRHDIRCIECGSNWVVKNGKQKGKQTYLCRDCNRRFTPEAQRVHHPKDKKQQAISMFCEGMPITAIARTLKIPYPTVYSWIYREGKKSKAIVDKKIEELQNKKFKKISFDEMWTYEKARGKDKRQEVWIWTVVLEDENSKRKKIMMVGDRREEDFLKSDEKDT